MSIQKLASRLTHNITGGDYGEYVSGLYDRLRKYGFCKDVSLSRFELCFGTKNNATYTGDGYKETNILMTPLTPHDTAWSRQVSAIHEFGDCLGYRMLQRFTQIVHAHSRNFPIK